MLSLWFTKQFSIPRLVRGDSVGNLIEICRIVERADFTTVISVIDIIQYFYIYEVI
jgi:hypothetical protein